ncbi:hypothetical protein QBC47DRAFT_396046 [Echria macrotheca]|uniref:Uncharacterized protein n=1 Tax=Echria macrotheca TaxID=438768 RepID=A0AAJ0BLA1_9PEZI|nr:hypothetical protein QBC47DRAFT_396046 [Echria macrotheca]
MNYTGGYKQVASADTDAHHGDSAEPSPTIVASAPNSPRSERVSMQFTKAAFAFKDKLEDVRKHKSQPVVHEEALPTPTTQNPPKPEPATSGADAPQEAKSEEDPVTARKLRILRLVQSTLTSFLSIAIAILQGKAYLSYQQTKNTPGAWPTHPNLLPTLMLMVIAILAGSFDLCLLLAYLFPTMARTFLRIATKSYNILTCAKGVSYVLVSAVCKGGFDYGNASGQNNDLWGWTCSSAADKFDSLTQASANCSGQTAAWYIALVTIAIEGIGIFGTFFINQSKRKAAGKEMDSAEFAAEFEKLAAWGQEVDKAVGGITPQAGGKGS